MDAIVTVTLNTAIDRVLEVPNFRIGEHARGRQVSRYPAGKSINVSRALARLKRPNTATGFVGRNDFALFEEYLEAAGPGRVTCQLLSVRGETRENVTLIDPVNHTDTHVRDQGFEVVSADVQRMVTKVGLLARPGSVMVFSGSLPRGMDVNHLNMLLNVAIGGGAHIVMDVGGSLLQQLTGVEPAEAATGGDGRTAGAAAGGTALPAQAAAAVTPEHSVASAAAVAEAGGFWLVKPNLQELAEATGTAALHDEDAIAAAAARVARHVGWVLVTLAEKGAMLVGGGGTWRGRLPVDPARIVNTVGCGDCMVAGMIDAHLRQGGPMEMLRRGLAVATANALVPGIATFDLKQVEALEREAQVEQRSLAVA